MPNIVPSPGCSPCGIGDAPSQHMFLGLSVASSFDASVGWNNDQGSLTVILVEDPCNNNKVYYNECLTKVNYTGPDFGFWGEPRWTDGVTPYSACSKKHASHTLVRNGLTLVGLPAYFRVEDFEWCGIISDWTKTIDPQRGTTYQVKLVDPRIVLQGVELIVGEYCGAVSQTYGGAGTTGCPSPNIINVYGYTEAFGVPAPLYVNGIDGAIFGTPYGGFGGSYSNESGMPFTLIRNGFNSLVNTINQNRNDFSPFGRCVYINETYPTGINGVGCGLMDRDIDTSCFGTHSYYLVDLSELPDPGLSYRFQGPTVSILELIDRMSQDFGFDYYIEMVPVKYSGLSTTSCIAKFIKLRVVYRASQPDLTQICEFLEASACPIDMSMGVELRNETTAKFVVGGQKYIIWQAEQGTNPDADFTTPANDEDTLASINGDTETVTLRPTRGDGIPILSGGAKCSEIDDMIIPYFGLDGDGGLLDVCMDDDGNWFFDAPVSRISGALRQISSHYSYVRISEPELRAALQGFNDWITFIVSANTETAQLLPSEYLAYKGWDNLLNPLMDGLNIAPRDLANPRLDKFFKDGENAESKLEEDVQTIFEWVSSYAQENYGKTFAVRVPHTACWLDTETGKVRTSEQPTNEGGWSEVSPIIGLPNTPIVDPSGAYLTNFARNDDGRIRAFVRFDNALLLDPANLGGEDYFYYYVIDSGVIAQFTSGSGPPTGATATGKPYIDTDSGLIYLYDHIDNLWLPITDAVVASGSGPPDSSTQTDLYIDTDDNQAYIQMDEGTNDWEEIDVYLYVKAEVKEEYVFRDKAACFGPRVIVSIPQAVQVVREEAEQISGLFLTMANFARRTVGCSSGVGAGTGMESIVCSNLPEDQDQLLDAIAGLGDSDKWMALEKRAAMISAAAIPMKSNSLTYGPWVNPSVVGGRTEVFQDPNLVPWQFGSYANLNIAGQLIANGARVDMKCGEIGQITVPGIPTLPLGAELGALGGGFFGGGTHLVENRTIDTGTVDEIDSGGSVSTVNWGYFSYGGSWTGLYGPNITGISVRGDSNAGFQTTYTMRTFAPRRNFFSKWLYEQMQRLNTNVQKQISYVKGLRQNDSSI